MQGRSPTDGSTGAPHALLGLLGLAARARALVHGTDAARGAAREGKLAGVLVAADASPTQTRKLVPLLQARGIPVVVCLSRDRLGAAIGRGAVTAVGITQESFARQALRLAGALTREQDPGGELH